MVYESKLIIGYLLKLTEKSKSKYSLHTSHVAHQARAYPGALSIQQKHWFKFSESCTILDSEDDVILLATVA